MRELISSKPVVPKYAIDALSAVFGSKKLKALLVSGKRVIRVELYPSDIAKFVLWNAPGETQDKISFLVKESHLARKKAKELIKRAEGEITQALDSDQCFKVRKVKVRFRS